MKKIFLLISIVTVFASNIISAEDQVKLVQVDLSKKFVQSPDEFSKDNFKKHKILVEQKELLTRSKSEKNFLYIWKVKSPHRGFLGLNKKIEVDRTTQYKLRNWYLPANPMHFCSFFKFYNQNLNRVKRKIFFCSSSELKSKKNNSLYISSTESSENLYYPEKNEKLFLVNFDDVKKTRTGLESEAEINQNKIYFFKQNTSNNTATLWSMTESSDEQIGTYKINIHTAPSYSKDHIFVLDNEFKLHVINAISGQKVTVTDSISKALERHLINQKLHNLDKEINISVKQYNSSIFRIYVSAKSILEISLKSAENYKKKTFKDFELPEFSLIPNLTNSNFSWNEKSLLVNETIVGLYLRSFYYDYKFVNYLEFNLAGKKIKLVGISSSDGSSGAIQGLIGLSESFEQFLTNKIEFNSIHRANNYGPLRFQNNIFIRKESENTFIVGLDYDYDYTVEKFELHYRINPQGVIERTSCNGIINRPKDQVFRPAVYLILNENCEWERR